MKVFNVLENVLGWALCVLGIGIVVVIMGYCIVGLNIGLFTDNTLGVFGWVMGIMMDLASLMCLVLVAKWACLKLHWIKEN